LYGSADEVRSKGTGALTEGIYFEFIMAYHARRQTRYSDHTAGTGFLQYLEISGRKIIIKTFLQV
jgi:hypothetical protein